MAQNQVDDPEIPGLAALDRLFAMALWDPKQDSAGNAYSEIKKTTKAGEKSEIIKTQFAAWRRGSVSAIKEFFLNTWNWDANTKSCSDLILLNGRRKGPGSLFEVSAGSTS
jgi:hypothetical protein